MKAPRRGLRLVKFQLLLFLLVGFLLPDVLPDALFGQTDRAHAVPARPEVVAREVPLPTEILSMDPDRRLPFQKPHRVGHAQNPSGTVTSIKSFETRDKWDATLGGSTTYGDRALPESFLGHPSRRRRTSDRASARPNPVALPVSCCARERGTSHLFRIVPEYFGSKFSFCRPKTALLAHIRVTAPSLSASSSVGVMRMGRSSASVNATRSGTNSSSAK